MRVAQAGLLGKTFPMFLAWLWQVFWGRGGTCFCLFIPGSFLTLKFEVMFPFSGCELRPRWCHGQELVSTQNRGQRRPFSGNFSPSPPAILKLDLRAGCCWKV